MAELYTDMDPKTQVYTKEAFIKLTTTLLSRTDSAGILLFDIDNLKYINYCYGFENGDQILIYIVRQIQNVLPKNAIMGRVGEDEFAIFISKLEEGLSWENFAERIQKVQSAPIALENKKINVTVSIGVMPVNDRYRGLDATELLEHVNLALGEAKKAGGNQYAVYDETTFEKYERKSIIIDLLLSANSERERITAFFQPLFHIKDYKLIGFEALCRLYHEKIGEIAPEEFIGVAQQYNLMFALDVLMLQNVCKAIRSIAEAGETSIKISLNVSPETFVNKRFMEYLKESIEEYRINPSQLAIEIIEYTFFGSFEQAREVIEEMQSLGIIVMIDDFGTGYSNLLSVQQLNINVLKIDKALINSINSYLDKSNILLKKTIEIANYFDINIVAEGIENEEQLRELEKLNCSLGQGFLYARPMNEEAMLAFIKERREQDEISEFRYN